MRKFSMSLLAASLVAAPAFALTVSEIDADGDSLISFDEMLVVYPDLTSEAFDAVDSSGDSYVDAFELSAALDSGLIVPPAQ
ncbi:hypothetical protein [Shimia sp.]|uniref:hypothetical protein n=1 Tax=Shimia sp. TaxID=1954381 RepID=UPI003B8D9737